MYYGNQIRQSCSKILEKSSAEVKNVNTGSINGLTQKPPKGDIGPLQGYKDGRQRLRVGKYRVIYRYTQDGGVEILVIMEIGSRGDIYK